MRGRLPKSARPSYAELTASVPAYRQVIAGQGLTDAQGRVHLPYDDALGTARIELSMLPKNVEPDFSKD